MAAPTKVLYIAGSGRSCTTLFGHILGQVPGFCFIGEAMYAWQALGDRLCGCGAPLEDCEFWNAVRREAAGDLPPAPADFFGLGQVTRWRDLPLTYGKDREPRLAARYRRHWQGTERLYQATADLSGAEVVVDSSKSVPYGRMLGLLPGLDTYVVHLVRDARAVTHSWKRRKAAPDRFSSPYMGQRGTVRSAAFWSASNLGAELFCRRPGRYLRLRYEDFAERPRPAVESVLRMVANRPLALPFVGERTVTLGRTHSIKGNPNRLQVGAVEIAVDDRWRTGMAAGDRRLVTALTWPLLAHYSYLGGARHPDPQSLEPESSQH